jgi:DNA-binding MarR family transcriptional regulator
MASKEIKMAQLIWQIRRLFQKLSSESNEFLTIYGITASQRAVLEFLDHKDPETLANMARAHDVSRQHIQQIVNDLLEKQLVITIENPAHKRSFLVQRTDKGNRLFADIKKMEHALFARMVKEFDSKDIQTSLDTLKKFNQLLQSDTWMSLKQQFIKKKEV